MSDLGIICVYCAELFMLSLCNNLYTFFPAVDDICFLPQELEQHALSLAL